MTVYLFAAIDICPDCSLLEENCMCPPCREELHQQVVDTYRFLQAALDEENAELVAEADADLASHRAAFTVAELTEALAAEGFHEEKCLELALDHAANLHWCESAGLAAHVVLYREDH